jgi:hypothetical protein
MSRLVLVVPLADGAKDRARELLDQGPPFDPETTDLERHSVYLTDHEAVFVFETPGDEPPLELRAEDPALLGTAEAWRDLMAGRPRIAQPAFSWERET